MRLFALLYALARAFPSAFAALARHLPGLARLAVLLTLGAGGYAVYDGYDAIRDRFQEKWVPLADTVGERAERSGERIANTAERVWTHLEENPEASLLGLALSAAAAVYYRRKGHSLRASLTAAALRVAPGAPSLGDEPARPLTARDKALNRAAVKELTDQHDALERRIKQLPDEIAQGEKQLKALTEEATQAGGVAKLKERNRREAEEMLAEKRTELASAAKELNELEAEFDRLERLT